MKQARKPLRPFTMAGPRKASPPSTSDLSDGLGRNAALAFRYGKNFHDLDSFAREEREVGMANEERGGRFL